MPQIKIEVSYYADVDEHPYESVTIGTAAIRVPELDAAQQAHLAAKIGVDAHVAIVRLSSHLEARGVLSQIKEATEELARASAGLPPPVVTTPLADPLADGDHFAGDIGNGGRELTADELEAAGRDPGLRDQVAPV